MTPLDAASFRPPARSPAARPGPRAARVAGSGVMQGHIHKRVRTDRSGKERSAGTSSSTSGSTTSGRRRQKWHGELPDPPRGRGGAGEAGRRAATTGSYVSPAGRRSSSGSIDSWLPMMEPRVKPTTFYSYKRNLEIHVLPALGSKPLQQLTPPMLNVALRQSGVAEVETRNELSAKTISYIHSIVHKVLADAVDAGLLEQEPGRAARSRRGRAGVRPPASTRGSRTSSPRSSRLSRRDTARADLAPRRR